MHLYSPKNETANKLHTFSLYACSSPGANGLGAGPTEGGLPPGVAAGDKTFWREKQSSFKGQTFAANGTLIALNKSNF